jgi:hypothetical protein
VTVLACPSGLVTLVRLPWASYANVVECPSGSVTHVIWLKVGSYVKLVVTAPDVPASRVSLVTFPAASWL